jgi:hypothetical protein
MLLSQMAFISFRTQDVLQEIINNKTKITSPLIAAKVGSFFMSFAAYDEGKKMATTKEVYDVIINHCAKLLTTAESIQRVGLAIGNIAADNPDGQRLFSTPETASALLNVLQKYATTDSTVESLSFGVGCIVVTTPTVSNSLRRASSFQHSKMSRSTRQHIHPRQL